MQTEPTTIVDNAGIVAVADLLTGTRDTAWIPTADGTEVSIAVVGNSARLVQYRPTAE